MGYNPGMDDPVEQLRAWEAKASPRGNWNEETVALYSAAYDAVWEIVSLRAKLANKDVLLAEWKTKPYNPSPRDIEIAESFVANLSRRSPSDP